MKRVVVVSDFHCGHIVGLTPPGWDNDRPRPQLKKSYKMRRAIWDFYTQTLKELQPIDILIVNGDCIDGRGEKSGGTELLYVDRTDQVDMAVDCILEAGAKKVVMSYGTGYHTGKEEDWERQIAGKVKATKIGSVDTVNVNGKIFNYRHYIGSSQVPHGRHTAIARDHVWNLIWAERGEYPRADVILRSHVHFHTYSGDSTWLGMTTPGLQGYGSKFGARTISGTVDIGLVHFDIEKDGRMSWEPHIVRMPPSLPVSL
jgi:hypothetical protein